MSGFLIGTFVLIIALFLTYTQYQVEIRDTEAETREVLSVIDQNFQYAIREINSIALLLSQSVEENGDVTRFEEISQELIEDYPSISVLELILDGIVTHVYPLEGYEEILGYDLYQNERIRRELLKAAANESIYFSGPSLLLEGELGVVGLLPFSINDEDIKIAAVVVYLESLLEISQISNYSDRYHFQLSKINLETNEEEFFISASHSHEINWSDELFVEIKEGDWKLYAHNISAQHFPTYIFILIVVGFALAGLIGFLSYKIFQKPFELELLLHKKSTELLVSREQFKKNSELLSSVLESPENIVIFSLDQNYNYIAFNDNHRKLTKRLFGVTIKDGTNVFDVLPESAKTRVKLFYDRTLKGESFDFTSEYDDPSSGKKHWQNWFSPIRDKDNSIIGLTVFSIDITKRIQAEKEKTTLLSEIHHRVKNNLAIVSGLLELQKVEVNDDTLSAIFDQSINRIISIAMVHELMYNTEDLSSVDVNAYLEKLIPAISATMQNKSQNVHFQVDIEEYQLNINEAIPLGLLLNELITNSFKYAFNGSPDNAIDVKLTTEEDNIKVMYSDNGQGFPEDVDFSKPKNLGLNLIHAQLAQLDATYHVDTDKKFRIEFSFTSHGKGSHSNF